MGYFCRNLIGAGGLAPRLRSLAPRISQLSSVARLVGPLVLIPLCAVDGRAELVTVKFAGTVTGVSVQNQPQLQGIDFPDVGDLFTGYYRFDSAAPDTANSPGQGSFHTVLSDKALVASIGDFEFNGLANVIVTSQIHYVVGDWIPSIELTSDPALAQILDHNNFSLVVRKDNLYLDPNELPSTPPSLDGALEHYLVMWMDSRNNPGPAPWVSIRASLDSLALVPEPLNLLPFGIASIWLLPIRRKRKGHSVEPQVLI
jgi:hypothetical protein